MKTKYGFAVRYLGISLVIIALLSSFGCETLRRKFTRKSKAEKENPEEVIYEPQEYPVDIMSNEELYRLYYSYWTGWQRELVDTLSAGQNHKRQVECIVEIVKNLERMRDLLIADHRAGLQEEIQKLLPIKGDIVNKRSNASNFYWMKMELESAKSRIAKEYLPSKIKPYIIK